MLDPSGRQAPSGGSANRNAAFKYFKRSNQEGIQLSNTIKDTTTQIKDAKVAVKVATVTVNTCKANIDAAVAALAAAPSEQTGGGGGTTDGVVDAEHFQQAQVG
jgi:hypothetical protein